MFKLEGILEILSLYSVVFYHWLQWVFPNYYSRIHSSTKYICCWKDPISCQLLPYMTSLTRWFRTFFPVHELFCSDFSETLSPSLSFPMTGDPPHRRETTPILNNSNSLTNKVFFLTWLLTLLSAYFALFCSKLFKGQFVLTISFFGLQSAPFPPCWNWSF